MTFTTEQLIAQARENVKALKMAAVQNAFKDIRPAIELDLRLAEIALSSLEAAAPQPVAVPDEVIVLLNHLEDVLPDAAFNLIDVKTWNNVSMLSRPDVYRAAMLQPSSGALQLPDHMTLIDKGRLSMLEESRRALLDYRADNLWYWQGDEDDQPELLSCPVIMSAATLRDLLTKASSQTVAVPDDGTPTDDERIMEIEGIVAVPDGYRLCLIPMEHTEAFHAACTAAFNEFERGTGPCGVFIAGHRAMLAAAPQEPTK